MEQFHLIPPLMVLMAFLAVFDNGSLPKKERGKLELGGRPIFTFIKKLIFAHHYLLASYYYHCGEKSTGTNLKLIVFTTA